MARAPRGFGFDEEYAFAVGRYNDGTESPQKMAMARGGEARPHLDARQEVDQAEFAEDVYRHSSGGRFCYRSDAVIKRTARRLAQFNEREVVFPVCSRV